MAESANFRDAAISECGEAAIRISPTSPLLASAGLLKGVGRKSSQHSLDDVIVL